MITTKSYSRREFLLTTIGAAAGSTFFSSRLIEPFWPEFNRKTVRVSKQLRQPIGLLHLSDLHAFDSMPLWYFQNALELALHGKPDIICLTGDFISRDLPDLAAYSAVLKRLSDTAPTFACLGNHDGGSWAVNYGGYPDSSRVLKMLDRAAIRCLENESALLQVHGQPVQLFGTTDLWTSLPDTSSLTELDPKLPLVVMAHNPDTKESLRDSFWDIMLSGHSHGGQFVYPLVGGTPFCVVKDKRFISGMNRWEGRWIHTSRGLGSIGGIRFNCPPESTLITLTGT